MAKYVELGEIREGEHGDYIKLTNYDKVEITVNGQKVNGKSIYLNKPEDKFKRFVDGGHMTQEEAEEAISKIPEYVMELLVLKLDD